MKRPNILFIISDQHNAKVLGSAEVGNLKNFFGVKTPNLDQLAANGVSFSNAVTQSPICTPSRVSFLSGQYPHNHGYYGLGGAKTDLPTFLGHFRKQGYLIGAVGKLHCPENFLEKDCDFVRDVSGPEYKKYLAKKGVVRDDVAYPEFGKRGIQSCDGRVSEMKYKDRPEGWIIRETIDFMKQAVTYNKPFVIQVGLPKPHQNYCPSEPFWSMYNEDDLVLPPNSEYDMVGKAPHLRKQAQWWRNEEWPLFEPKTFEAARLRKLHGYLGCVSQTDYAVGQLVSWLKENGLDQDTIIVYTSDHGDYACEHGIMEKAPGICSDAITRIPFIWYWPNKFKPGHVAKEIVEAVDLTNTLCALAGIESMPTSDGKDLSHLLRGGSGAVHKIAVTEFVWSKSIRKDNYRYVYYPKEMFAEEYPQGFGELYNLSEDPWEMKNLYFDDKHADLIKELERDLLDWLVTTARPRTTYGVNEGVEARIIPEQIREAKTKNYI